MGKVFAVCRQGSASVRRAVRRGVAGGGKALPAAVRRHMEPRFGASFADVRVHSDRQASSSAKALNARAYTFGKDVVFAAGQYAPETAAGRRLIAHELAHVVQQQGGGAAAQRVMRSPFPGCDKATTGVADADARIDAALKQADTILTTARARFPRMSSRTITLTDGHFHCPSNTNIASIIDGLGKIHAALPNLKPACVDAAEPFCADGLGHLSGRDAELCPAVFGAGNRAFRFAGLLVDAAALAAGFKNDCVRADACYGDFTVPASDMLDNAISYAALSVELAGHKLHSFDTIPCDPTDTGMLVDVTPAAVKDPSKIRDHTGFARAGDPPLPAGTRVLSVFRDQAGNRFIYHQDIAAAQVFTAKDAAENPPRKRFYLPR